MKSYNIIENGDYVLGKAKDIINYLVDSSNKLSEKFLRNEIDTDEYIDIVHENIKVAKEIEEFDYQAWVILKLYRNEFDELDYEELNI